MAGNKIHGIAAIYQFRIYTRYGLSKLVQEAPGEQRAGERDRDRPLMSFANIVKYGAGGQKPLTTQDAKKGRKGRREDCHRARHGYLFGGELRQVVDVETFFERRHQVEVEVESVTAECLLLNLVKFFAQGLIFLPGDDYVKGGK